MLASALLYLAVQDVRLVYEPFAGLQVKLNGVPFIVGSSFQYFDARTGKPLYSSRWAPKEVSRLQDGTIRVRYSGDNGNAIGTHEFTQRPGGMTVRYEFRWRGSGDVRVENCMAQFWAPAISHGDIKIEGQQLFAYETPMSGDWQARRLGAGTSFQFDAQLAKASLAVRGSPSALYDARGYGQDWAKLDCLFWLGQQQLIVHAGETTSVTADWEFEPRFHPHKDSDTVAMDPVPTNGALSPPSDKGVLVPKPKVAEPSSGYLDLLAGTTAPTAAIVDSLVRRWRIDPADVKFAFDSRIDPVGLEREGFEIRVTPAGVSVRAHDAAAQRSAVETLAELAEPRNGRLVIPCGTWNDWPSVQSRGVHIFSGQEALGFQRQLIERVLSPLRFNRVVVECSRTQWDATPESKTKPWGTKQDLALLFAAFREHDIEPVPLIQSFGHMDWLLDGEFKPMAVNPDIPYTLDPRKVKAKDLIKSVWREAAAALKPTTVHFGLDEISMRGMPDDPALPSRLWKLLVPELMSLAKEFKATPMAWSDMMLADGEAPDATHARDQADATAFRALLPRGAVVGDWHYKSTKDPTQFTSLALWKSLGMNPVATSWYQPDNIRSHTLAAVAAGAGTLQATWAGYETTESAIIRDPAQFSAYVLAADYAWSGRDDAVANLPYDPRSVLRELLWGKPEPVRTLVGILWSRGPRDRMESKVGNTDFQMFDPLGIQTPLTSEGSSCPSSVEIGVNTQATEVWLALDCVGWQRDTDPVAKITVLSPDGDTSVTVLYGADVRAVEDVRPAVRCESKAGVSAFQILLGTTKKKVTGIKIEPVSPTAGLRVRGVTTL